MNTARAGFSTTVCTNREQLSHGQLVCNRIMDDDTALLWDDLPKFRRTIFKVRLLNSGSGK
jgi:hypothetical protein